MQFNFPFVLSSGHGDGWLPKFPNPADFRFDYWKLLANSQSTGLARLPSDFKRKKVAVIGAGSAGMTAARELHRCGFEVTIFEASNRLGGRLYTKENPSEYGETGMEMGAMRMPFFSLPRDQNSILEYYTITEPQPENEINYQTFPNPGTAPGPIGTGIYMNNGLGPDSDFIRPKMIFWEGALDGSTTPDNEQLSAVAKKADAFITQFSNWVKPLYLDQASGGNLPQDWPTAWKRMVQFYGNMTFAALVRLPRLDVPDWNLGSLGGFGMSQKESDLLYTIGTGDGSWGAFYSVSALWFIRCTMFGFGGASLQTVTGYNNAELLPWFEAPVFDSANQPLPSPNYRGIQSLVEYLYYVSPEGQSSLHGSQRASLYLNARVHKIERTDAGIRLHTDGPVPASQRDFDFVFNSATQWATQMSMTLTGFDNAQLPPLKVTATKTQHAISSCKLFFPLKVSYWELEDNQIPQVIVTDTFLQDAYALSWDKDDPGVILASYTWEDDSLKLLPLEQHQLAKKVIDKLSSITRETVGQDISEYIDGEKPVMIQWITEEDYFGCSKLYRQYNEQQNYLDLSYNQNYAKDSRLYFVGETYSVEGGWTEPALRSAVDGVMQLLNHIGAEFTVTDFDFERDYPRWPSKLEVDELGQ